MARWMAAMDSVSSAGPYDVLMPMQPRPIAETSRPCLPSFRFSRLIDLLLCFGTCGCGYFLKTSLTTLMADIALSHPAYKARWVITSTSSVSERQFSLARFKCPRSCSVFPRYDGFEQQMQMR